MANDVVKKSSQHDGFDTYRDDVQGDDERVGGGAIQGTRVKFTNESV
jgi:hypothetical protein